MMNWFFWIWFAGFLISYAGFLVWCWKDGKITLSDLGGGFIISLFSWICIIVGVIVFGDNIIIWKRK